MKITAVPGTETNLIVTAKAKAQSKLSMGQVRRLRLQEDLVVKVVVLMLYVKMLLPHNQLLPIQQHQLVLQLHLPQLRPNTIGQKLKLEAFATLKQLLKTNCLVRMLNAILMLAHLIIMVVQYLLEITSNN
jgi:hypothetical protein